MFLTCHEEWVNSNRRVQQAVQVLQNSGPSSEKRYMAFGEGVAASMDRGEEKVECQAPEGQVGKVAPVMVKVRGRTGSLVD